MQADCNNQAPEDAPFAILGMILGILGAPGGAARAAGQAISEKEMKDLVSIRKGWRKDWVKNAKRKVGPEFKKHDDVLQRISTGACKRGK